MNWIERYSASVSWKGFIPLGQEGYDENDPRHGINKSPYSVYGCRCPACRKVASDYSRDRKRRLNPPVYNTTKFAPLGSEDYNPEDTRHGTLRGYNRGRCRCKACKQANADRSLEYSHRKNPDSKFRVDPTNRF